MSQQDILHIESVERVLAEDFGKLKPIKPSGEFRKGQERWWFECECGGMLRLLLATARRARDTGTYPGCSKCRGRCSADAAEVFGDCKVLGRTDKRSGTERLMRVLCLLCNSEFERTMSSLRYSVRRGRRPCCIECGCRQREHARCPSIKPLKRCRTCEGMAFRRAEDGTPCACGGVYQAETKIEPVLRRAV